MNHSDPPKTPPQKPGEDSLHPATLAVRAGEFRTAEGEHSEALMLTSSFVFANCAEGEQRMAQNAPGNVYSRYTNPTVRAFEQRLARLEGAEDAVATASGMAAILTACMALLQAGDHLVAAREIFGSTTVLLSKFIARFGVEVSFVPLTDQAAWVAAMRKNTRLLFLETPSNPLSRVADIAFLADLADRHHAKLVVDNCFCTPIFQRPLALRAHLSLHSATKYIDGQGRVLGGAVAGAAEDIAELRAFVRSCGPAMSPFNAWVLLKGLETLRLRMQAHAAGALALAHWLEAQKIVEQVYYSGLPSHPDHALAARQQSGFSGVLAFRVRGGRAAAWKIIDATRLMSLTPNLGDAKTTIVHPATTTHGRLTAAQRTAAGIDEGLIRISVGLEAVEDLQADLQQAFARQ
ncbi:MAG: O-succinylhomoserine sulfhydrylase [Cellvibrionales bacterium]|nr:O-succinylhomoserine sulfhydrylase [Cellvibrionales bacterium]